MDLLTAHADRHPDKPALIEGDRVWSWSRLVESRNRVGHALRARGLAPGESVIVYAANSIEHYLAGSGARAAGLIPAPMNHRLVAEEVAYILDHSDATAVFASDQFLPVVEEIRAGARKVRRFVLMGEARRDWA
jgi:acyl-CoA synthetase (AMP-forming)/AMP-acid ligase II